MAKAAPTPRLIAISVLTRVSGEGQSLSSLLPHAFGPLPPERRALAQELCYGTLRWWHQLEALLGKLMEKPLRHKDADIHCLLLCGLYQLAYMDLPPHAAVSETVAITATLNKGWAKGLVNAVLRRYLREREALEQQLADDAEARYAHPRWFIEAVREAWPSQWQAILEANNLRPPMTLRNARNHQSRDACLEELAAAGVEATASPHAPDALTLAHPREVEGLPGFAAGRLSVQDAAAQLAATLLAPQPGMRVLDACAAPGGKTGHLLEICSDITLVALDIDEKRVARIAANLERLQLRATLLCGDAAHPEGWWDGHPFDRILLDAPCSASGVIRRHPDIKLLRRPEDIEKLVTLQARILTALWPLLKPGGMLVYATCSVLPQENSLQLEHFLDGRGGARERRIAASWGEGTTIGRQI
ncbi:MAG: 16S rRNA (cytosine(967)-C(5))-methyltransferase RsmB, partial [Gammaproteobacteria bacterium]|nr:16S rRNA (cytosine(967)-C(5))-methyltransferase RsmB [Gammaproteobacteria bacterium]